MLEDLRTHLQEELRIPEIYADRCVHSLIETSSCQDCVDSCPQQAWILSDESLGINTEACDGCGLCAPACLQGAILHPHEPLIRQLGEHLIAFVACQKTPLTGDGVMPCIHALGVHDLLKLYQQDVHGLVIATDTCSECEQYSKNNLQNALNLVNRALTQRQVATFLLREVPSDSWDQQRQQTKDPVAENQIDRRHFFRQTLQTTAREALKLKGLLPQDKEKFIPPGLLLPETEKAYNLPYVPEIDAEQCDGCEGCLNICPHHALLFDKKNKRYVIAAQRCTGCQVCVDVCKPKAIQVKTWETPAQFTIDLHHGRCKRCGVYFYRPEMHQANQNLCHICDKVNHHHNLYQIFE